MEYIATYKVEIDLDTDDENEARELLEDIAVDKVLERCKTACLYEVEYNE